MNLAVVLLISLVGIYSLARAIQECRQALLVFAAAPYGTIGALIALAIMGTPSVSWHSLGLPASSASSSAIVIVLFDFIEEMHEKGSRLSELFPMPGLSVFDP